jgi:hypothetical protein
MLTCCDYFTNHDEVADIAAAGINLAPIIVVTFEAALL